jgi:hyperpolarization activated cyclic nucleotide-gated potassium channel 2
MTTVGYGDIIPKTSNEKIYSMASMILACGIFAYTVGSVGGIISKQNSEANLFRERSIAVNRYMKKKLLPYDLQFRVRRYLEYVWEN